MKEKLTTDLQLSHNIDEESHMSSNAIEPSMPAPFHGLGYWPEPSKNAMPIYSLQVEDLTLVYNG